MYYNQNSYPHIPYPAPGYESATLKTAGCGPCCAAMVAEGLTGLAFPPGEAAALALASGARVSGGTAMGTLGAALARRFGLAMATTDRVDALGACLSAGGWAVANVGGNRSGYTGLFSDGGHFIAVRGMAADGRLIVWDPGYYSGKLDKPGRKGRAEVRGHDILVAASTLEADCQSRSPRYYLFTGRVGGAESGESGETAPEPVHTPAPWAQAAWERAQKAGILDGTYPQSPLTREQLATVLARLELI